jgi:hypothetical protein
VLGPIEAEVATAIGAFTRYQRIDLLVQKDETMLYVAADLTDAFIKSFNAKPKR